MIVPKASELAIHWRDESLLKKRQAWVLLHPCVTYLECGRQGYRAIFQSDSGVKFITVLTIDLFTQPWAWHSQIGIIGPGGKAKLSSAYTLPERLEAVELAQYLVSGVGEGRPVFERDSLSLGFARTLTVSETHTAMAFQGNAPERDLFPVGEFNVYDAGHSITQAGESLQIPKTRTVLYGRGN